MRATEAGKQLGVSASTVRNYANSGVLNYTLNAAGQRVFTQKDLDDFVGKEPETRTVYYVRASNGNKELIQAQVDELTEQYGEPLAIYSDRGSGLNENRAGLNRLLRDSGKGKFNRVCVTHSDRLSRFGVKYIEQVFDRDGTALTILHDRVKHSLEDELMSDFMSLIASFSGRFYRLRSRASQQQLLTDAQEKLGSNE